MGELLMVPWNRNLSTWVRRGKYFLCQIYFQSCRPPWTKSHHSFIAYTWLLNCKSCSPSLPLSLCVVNSSQPIRAHFHFLVAPFHNKSIHSAWKSWVTANGIGMNASWWFDIACRTAFGIVRRLKRLSVLKVQMLILCWVFSKISSQDETMLEWMNRDTPKYLEGRYSYLNPNTRINCIWTWSRQWKKKILVFSLLTIVPDASIKSWRILIIPCSSFIMDIP